MQAATQFGPTSLPEGHIFLSYSSADRAAARQLVQALRRNGLKVWFDEDNLEAGARWMAGLEEAIQKASAMIVHVGRLGVQRWVDREVRFGLERNTCEPAFRLIPVISKGADFTDLPPFLSQHQAVDLRDNSRFPEQVQRLVESLQNGQAQRAVPNDCWVSHSPFRSLQVFEPEDSWLFYGRDSETDDLLARLARDPVVAVLGNSGSGKSSLIRAGLIPALRCGRFRKDATATESWQIAIFRPSQAPFDYLAETLPGQLLPELSRNEQMELIADLRKKLPLGDDALRNAVSALASAESLKGKGRILLIVDQFEEIFTLTSDRETRERYISALLAASRPGGAVSVHLILALRADFFGACLEHAELSRRLPDNLYTVPRMDAKHLRDTIEKRLALAAGHAEAGLIDSLLADVGSEPGDLALLEHALDQLWEKRGPNNRLTNHAYVEIGRLRGALGRHADQVYADIGGEAEQRMVQTIFLDLVQLGEGAQDTRRRIAKQELLHLGSSQQVETLLQRLASSRLISTSGEGEASFVEISHEALIREWPRFRQWLTLNRDDLRLERRLLDAAQEWNTLNREPSALLQGSRLYQAADWLDKHSEAAVLLKEFVGSSISAQEEAHRKDEDAKQRELTRQQDLRREAEARASAETRLRIKDHSTAVRFRWLASALGLLLFTAAAIAWYARQQQLLGESRALAAKAEELLPRDQEAALNLALHSWQIAKTPEASIAISNTWPQVRSVLKHDGPVRHASFSSDGQHILTVSDDNTARLWDANSGLLLATLQQRVSVATFSIDGQRILTTCEDNTVRLWNTGSGLLLATLQHNGPVREAEFSPSGQRIITASEDNTARLWDAGSGQLLATLQHNGPVREAEFSLSGQRIITASEDNTARLWNAGSGQLLATLQNDGPVREAKFSPGGQFIVTASEDNTARLWNGGSGQLLATLQNDAPVVDAAFSPDSQHIVTVSNYKGAHLPDGSHMQVAFSLGDEGIPILEGIARAWNTKSGQLLTALKRDSSMMKTAFSLDDEGILTPQGMVRVWNTKGGQLVATLKHTDDAPVNQASFSPDGQHIVTASDDKTARIWNAQSGQLLVILKHDQRVSTATFSIDGQHVVTTSDDKTARVWNAQSGQLLAILKHDAPVHEAAFSADGRQMVTASDDKTARVWNTGSGQLLVTLQGAEHWQASFSPNCQRIATTSDRDNQTVWVWNADSSQLLATLKHSHNPVLQPSFSVDGQRIVTINFGKTAWVWNASNGQLVATLQHDDEVHYAAFSPDGQHIVTDDGTARIWSADNGKLLATLKHDAAVKQAAFSPDGQRIVTVSYDGARIWNADNGQLLVTLKHDGPVRQAAFSPDGHRIVTASESFSNTSSAGTARVWNADNGQLLATLKHGDEIHYAAFSPDGHRIITASEDRRGARMWDADSGRPLAILKHDDQVSDAAFSPDGQHIVTASSERTARVWNADSGQLLATLKHDAAVWQAAFSPDGQSIITASADSTARVWDAGSGQLLATLRHDATVAQASFSSNSERIATISMDGKVRVWHLVTLSDLEKEFAR